MRILQLVRCMDIGGLEVFVADLSGQLAKQRHEVLLGCLTHAGPLAATPCFRSRWVGLARSGWPGLDPLCLLRLVRFVRREGVEVIHSHNTQAMLYALLAAPLTGARHVHTVHGRGVPGKASKAWKAVCLRRVSRRGSLVAVSSDLRRLLVERDGIKPERVCTVVNGLDIRRFSRSADRAAWRVQHGIPEGAFVIGSVGRFSREKCYPGLVAGFSRYRKGGGDGILLLVGDGPERAAVDAAIREYRVEDAVLLPGAQREIVPWLRSIDVFCLFSSTEGMPVSLLEASAAGLPSVVTDVGGNREVLDGGRCGLLIESGDEEALSLALQSLHDDPARRQQLGERARRRVRERYSIESSAQRYLTLYREGCL
ncbi:MAG: glycosyltransferase [Lentisphaerae bacterium]|nr:glycosyltransferase [Lentisphaerota bacterium]